MRKREEKFPDNGFEAWGGYMQAKIAKLEEQFEQRVENKVSDLFCGISIYVNGYTRPPAEELKLLMSAHGGIYHSYQRKEDIIIASNLPDTKVKNMSLSRVVKPEWILDCLKEKKILDYRNYLLYGVSKSQPKLMFKTEPKLEDKLVSKICVDKYNIKNDVPKSNTSSSTENVKTNKPINKTAADPNFISEFYNNSRLHHISQLGATFKQYINDLREESNFNFPARRVLKERINAVSQSSNEIKFEGGKSIMHIDMDCFFVSVGLRTNPELRGKPVAVTHSKGGKPKQKRSGVDRNTEFNLIRQKQANKLSKTSGLPQEEIYENIHTRVDDLADEGEIYGSMSEIASCSYEARAKGIKNGMFMGAALKLCPDLETIPYDFEGYKEVAYTLYNTIAQYTLDIEAVSCDEMYVDCTELLRALDISAESFATVLREDIKSKTGCPCSTGFGGNRLQARLATKRAKPDGQFFLFSDLVQDYMFDIKLRDLPGVGRQIAQKLEMLGHETCGSLLTLPLSTLQQHLGHKTGLQLYDQCRGKDPNPLSFHTVRKSVSAEVNYGIRFENNHQCYDFLRQLSQEVQSRMQQYKLIGKCITLKLMVRAEDAPVETAKFMGHGFCNIINKSVTLATSTNDSEIIAREVTNICKKQNIDPKEMRGIGIQVTKLESSIAKPTEGAISKYLKKECFNITEQKNNDINPNENNSTGLEQQIKKEKYLSPTKNVKKSPTKKSPIILPKSPQGRRRGRPPKNQTTQPKNQANSSKSLMSKFLQGQTSVFSFKQEIFDLTEPQVINLQEESSRNTEGQFGLIGLPWPKVRELLRAWLESGLAPLPCDIDLLSTYMKEMVINRHIDHLIILINFLRRRTTEIDCENWKNVYHKIVDEVQNAMIAVYGKKLYIA